MNWTAREFIWLDWLVLAVGVVCVVWAVYRALKKDKEKMKGADSQDYLFGKGEPWYVIGMAIFAANIGSEHLVGLAGTGAKDGVGMAHWEMQGWMILILGWLFVPFYQLLNNKMGKIITMPDFLKFRYTKATGSWLSIITLIAYILTKVSVTAFTGGIFFEYLSHWFAILVGCSRTYCHHGNLHRNWWYEGCDDNVVYPDTYSYYWCIPRSLPWTLSARRWKHC